MGNGVEKEYEIHYYEIDYRRKAQLTSIVDYLGDIATYHAEQLGIGIDYLAENQLGWVLYKWVIKMNKYPMYGEKIKIKTWSYSLRKFYAYRQFEIMNGKGEVIGTADSIWFLISLEKRKPVRISENIYRAFEIDLDEKKSLEIENIKDLSNINYEKIFNIRYSDIDTNRHVNNAKYMAWMLETIPVDIVTGYVLKEIKITYEKETRYGERITAETECIEENEHRKIYRHKIKDSSDQKITLGETIWEKE